MMMMMGEGVSPNPGIHGPPWSLFDDGLTEAALSALQLHLSSNESHYDDSDEGEPNVDSPIDVYSCDEFRIYEFKVRRCERVRSHDWTECPYAHPGERARRRDPRKYHYCGTACPDFRKSGCRRGDSCEFAHGVFESWLHPARYRTQPCKDGTACRRRVCFFAHTPDQLRVLPNQQSPRSCSAPESYDGSPLRRCSVTPPSESGSGVNEMMASLRQLQLSKVKSLPSSLWGVGFVGEDFGSPRSTGFRMDFYSLPSTPTGAMMVDPDREERVESGRALRARMVERLKKEMVTASPGPDVGWVSELVI